MMNRNAREMNIPEEREREDWLGFGESGRKSESERKGSGSHRLIYIKGKQKRRRRLGHSPTAPTGVANGGGTRGVWACLKRKEQHALAMYNVPSDYV